MARMKEEMIKVTTCAVGFFLNWQRILSALRKMSGQLNQYSIIVSQRSVREWTLTFRLAPCKALRLLRPFHCCYQIFCPNSIPVVEKIRREVGNFVFISEVTVSQSRLAFSSLNWGFLCFGFGYDYISVYCSFGDWFMSHLTHPSWYNNSFPPLPPCVKAEVTQNQNISIRTVILKDGQAQWKFWNRACNCKIIKTSSINQSYLS
jgi:hypothetical protein